MNKKSADICWLSLFCKLRVMIWGNIRFIEGLLSNISIFKNPFWIGLYERIYKNKLEVCKITFGKEPTDGEVYEFMLKIG